MMDLGFICFVDLDAAAPVTLVCRNGSLVPTTPTGSPTFTWYDSTGAVVYSGSFPSSDHNSKTGVRFKSVTFSAANGFSTGIFSVYCEWVISGTTYGGTGTVIVT